MKNNKILVTLVLLFLIVGCGSGYGIYHTVRPGETVEMISRAYGLSEEKLVRANKIADPAAIKTGDGIWIPGADRTLSAQEVKTPGQKKAYRPAVTKKTPPPPAEAPRKATSSKVSFQWPLKGEVFSRFGSRNGEVHDGIDIRAAINDEIRAAAAGRVIYSGSEIKSYGHMVIIKHEGRYSTVYAHNKENLVKKGSFVKAGDVIALVGESGISSGPSLHFEIRKGKEAVDPLTLLP